MEKIKSNVRLIYKPDVPAPSRSLAASQAGGYGPAIMNATESGPTRLIQMWSGPRNVSTALMYSFAQRPDTAVVDEPLYGHYLHLSGADHPGREQVIAAMDLDGDRVLADLHRADRGRPVLFAKQMAHHLLGIDYRRLADSTNFLLIRDPVEMLPSLDRIVPEPGLADTGLKRQVELFEALESQGQKPFCIDARELLADPAGVLGQACERLGLEFLPAMLGWPSGPRPEDGVWAPYWYGNVHRSRGFKPWRPPSSPFPDSLRDLLDECRPYYQQLFASALRARGEP